MNMHKLKVAALIFWALLVSSCEPVNSTTITARFTENEALFDEIAQQSCALVGDLGKSFNYDVGDLGRRGSFLGEVETGVSYKDTYFDTNSEDMSPTLVSQFQELEDTMVSLEVDTVMARKREHCTLFVPAGDIRNKIFFVYQPSSNMQPFVDDYCQSLSKRWQYCREE